MRKAVAWFARIPADANEVILVDGRSVDDTLPEAEVGSGSRAAASEGVLPRIFYVAGMPRSGSTVLGVVLGGIPDAIFVGELEAFWWQFAKNELCGCGQPLPGCPFWSAVVERAFGQVTRERAHELSLLERAVFGGHGAYGDPRPHVFAPLQWPSRRSQRIGVILRERARLYRAIGEVANTACVVDSSKEVRYGGVLARMGGADFSIIHLVRDPRGVVFSWRKGRLYPPPLALSALKPALYWVQQNLLVQFLLHRLGNAYVRVRYEDLVQRPADIRRTIAEATSAPVGRGRPETAVALVGGEHHQIRGNPRVRKRLGEGLQLSLDEEWRAGMPRGQRWLVTGACSLMMMVYGYPLSSSRPRTGRGRESQGAVG